MATKAVEPDAKLVLDRWSDADKSLMQERKDFWLNLAFFEGKQWIRWDDTKRIISNTFNPAQYENQRVHVTINKIQERVNMLNGRFCQRNLSFEAQPTSSDDATISRAKTAEKVAESRRAELGWEDVREEEVFDLLMGGTAAVGWDWDGSAGKELWQDSGSGKIVGQGEVNLRPFSIAEFSVEPGVRRWQEARWWVSCLAVPPAALKDQYGMDKEPPADVTGGNGPIRHQVYSGTTSADQPDLTAVYELWEKPHPGCEKGRHIVVIDSQCVVKEDWPFESTDLNLYVFRCLKVAGRWTGQTMVTAARQPQILYNINRSTMVEHMKLAGNSRLLMPHGSVDDDLDLTDEPGEILRYWPDSGAQPGYLSPPQIPRWITEQDEKLEAELDGILHSHAVSRGEAPGDRNSGLALSILAEKNDTPLGPTARDQANGWGVIVSNALRLYSKKAPEKRIAVSMSSGGVPNRLEWSGDKIGDQWMVSVPIESVMPTSKAGTQAMVIQMAQAFPMLASGFTLEKVLATLDIPGMSALDALTDSNQKLAKYENDVMATGEYMLPEKWHDHGKHIAEHNDFRNSTEWLSLPEDIKVSFELHIHSHQRLVEEELTAQAAANAVLPGIAAAPQADAPIGSAIPPPSSAAPSNVVPIQQSQKAS